MSRRDVSLVGMIRRRERFGPCSSPLTRAHRSLRLKSVAANSDNNARQLINNGVLLGLSHDSRYVLVHVHHGPDGAFVGANQLDFAGFDDSGDGDDNDNAQSLVLCQLTPQRLQLLIQFPMRVSCLCYIYAFFPRNCSFLATIAYPCDQMAPHPQNPAPTMTVQTTIDVLLISCNLMHVSAKLNVLTSCRWRQRKLTSHPLRVFDQGIICNTGTTVVALTFQRPPLDEDSWASFITQSNADVNRNVWIVTAARNIGRIPLDGTLMQNMLVEEPRGDEQVTLTIQSMSAEKRDEATLILMETWLEIEPLIDEVAREVTENTQLSYVGLIDYEVDVLDVNEGQIVMLVTCVIETSTATIIIPDSYLFVFDALWNVRASRIDHLNVWKGLRHIERKIARKPNLWYPFYNMNRKLVVDEIPLSNSPFMKGISLERLQGYFGGIALVK